MEAAHIYGELEDVELVTTGAVNGSYWGHFDLATPSAWSRLDRWHGSLATQKLLLPLIL